MKILGEFAGDFSRVQKLMRSCIDSGEKGSPYGWLAPGGYFRRCSMASQISAAMLTPSSRPISWMPVGEVTLISVR